MSNEPHQLPYQMTIEEVVNFFNSSKDEGLKSSEVESIRAKYGFNEILIKKKSWIIRLLLQFHNPLIYLLLVTGTITGILTILGEDMLPDTLVIYGVVVFNAILGFFQEGKAEGALEALKKMEVPECKIIRDNRKLIIKTRELVPGDVVLIEQGDKVPADCRLLSAKNLHSDEAALTGESVPINKKTENITNPDLPPGDQKNMIFAGTFLTKGTGQAIVASIGYNTQFGKIAKLVKDAGQTKTPLQRKIEEFTNILIIAIMAIGFINFGISLYNGYSLIYSFLGAVSLVVAAIPEMLPALITAILAFAATRMAKNKALVRKLPAAETLGCVDTVCSDKTGTLTKNEMTVVKIYADGKVYSVSGIGYQPEGDFLLNNEKITDFTAHEGLISLLSAGFFNNDSHLTAEQTILGDPTEGALRVSAAKADIVDKGKRVEEIPFDSSTKYMATLHEFDDKKVIYVKGSPEKVLTMCGTQLENNNVVPLENEKALKMAGDFADEALRVIGFACKEVPKEHNLLTEDDLKELTFLGLQGMIDPPKEDAIIAVAEMKKAGISTKMITGDHKKTAAAIARNFEIPSDKAITGKELNELSDEKLFEELKEVNVFARVEPEHKQRIASLLQKNGHIVAMTGDGVNDAPALKQADIGVGMGITGTEVSKEASDMVLLDDNFATIVKAIEEGRHAWNNLMKAILYTLPTNAGQALLVILAVLLAPFFPIFIARFTLEPVQILWVNLFDSVFLTMPLMMELKEKGLLLQPPRDAKAKIADSLFFQRVVAIGFAIALPGLYIYHHFGATAVDKLGNILDPLLLTQAQTAAFWAVLMVHFGFVMSARSIYKSAFTFSPFGNKWLLFGVSVSVITRLLPTFVPEVAFLFRTAEFPAEWWFYIIPCVLPGFLVLEFDKLMRRIFGK